MSVCTIHTFRGLKAKMCKVMTSHCITLFQGGGGGGASFGGYAYTLRKLKILLRRLKNSEMRKNDARFPLMVLVCVPSVIVCPMRCFRRPCFAYAVRIASMILHTTRFICVIYADIRVNATAAFLCAGVLSPGDCAPRV